MLPPSSRSSNPFASTALSAGKRSTPRLDGGGEALGLADDRHDQVLRIEQALGGAFGVGERHCLDLGVALVDILGTQVLLPEEQQLVGDLGVAVEAQCE